MDQLPKSTQELFTYDPEKAKKLLAEAGYPNGFKTELETFTGSEDQVALVAADLKKIGVIVDIKMREYAASLSIMTNKTHTGLLYESVSHGSPYSACSGVAYKGAITTWNGACWDDPKYNADYEKIQQMTDPNQLFPAIKAIGVYFLDQAPYIWQPVQYRYRFAWPWAKNYYGELNFVADAPGTVHTYVWLDQKMKANR
jgi:peptide/nickel transport system substrate-binding protein